MVALTAEVVMYATSARRARHVATMASFLVLTVALAACGSSGSKPVSSGDAAQARVNAAQQDVTQAQQKYDQARTQFCTDSKTYIEAIDRYGKLFDDSTATVGDVKTAGKDLGAPRAAVESSAQNIVATRDALAAAQRDLVEAQNALAATQTSVSTTTLPPPTTTTIVPAASIDRVKAAETEFEQTVTGISDQTPLVHASVQLNSAAFALEVAWLRVFADAGCFSSEEQHAKAVQAVVDYTTALQQELQAAGYYSGKIDGIYGPATVAAVEQLQRDAKLPVTGLVDRATSAALDAAVRAKGGEAAKQALLQTAAVQSTLKLAGYWTGPVDGMWTPELTDALKRFQQSLGVPPTGVVDAATLQALEAAITAAKTPTTPTTSAATPTTTAPTTTAP
jgi:peptidoglycan hydrolase-like protein with peptidoglycan-binding domain